VKKIFIFFIIIKHLNQKKKLIMVWITDSRNNIKKNLSGCQPVFDENANVFR